MDISRSIYKNEKKKIKVILKEGGFEDIKITNGFYHFSGFATKNNKVIYFSYSADQHGFRPKEKDKFLFRKAKDYQDFAGGVNNFVHVDDKDKIVKTINNIINN